MIIGVAPYRASYDAIQKRLEDMGKADHMRSVMLDAINELALETKHRTHQETTAMYTIKGSVFSESDIKKRTSKKNMEAVLKVKGAPLSIWKGYAATANTGKTGATAMIKTAGGQKKLEEESGGRTYKAFLATMKKGHESIFRRKDNKFMDEEKRPKPTKRIHRKKARKKREAIEDLITLAKSKAVEMAYKKNVQKDIQVELIYRMLKHMNAVIGG